MTKRAIINVISCVVAIAMVITSGFFVFRHFNSDEEVVLINRGINENNSDSVPNDSTGEMETTIKSDTDKKVKENPKNQYTPSKDHVSSNTGKDTESSSPDEKDIPVSKESAKKEAGLLGFLWDEVDKVFYSVTDPWQRILGFNQIHDIVSNFIVLYYDTVKIRFNYDGYDWLIQFWKGQYGFALLGAEVGIYYKDEGSPNSNYLCSNNDFSLKVGYNCYDNGVLLFSRSYQDTWWLTGFVPGKLLRFNDRSEMTLKIRINLNNYKMKNAFVKGLESVGFVYGNADAESPDTYYTNGNNVYIYWKNISSK